MANSIQVTIRWSANNLRRFIRFIMFIYSYISQEISGSISLSFVFHHSPISSPTATSSRLLAVAQRRSVIHNNAPNSSPSIPTAFSGLVIARKNFTSAPENGKSIQSPVGIRNSNGRCTGFLRFSDALPPTVG